MKVCIVDDEAPARQRLSRMLESCGEFVIDEARDAMEALERLGRSSYDALFLDIKMPGISGLELARSTRELPPVVFVTAYGEHALEAFDVCAFDYLVKPVRRERLLETLARLRLRTPKPAPAPREEPSAVAVRVVAASAGKTSIFDAARITRFWAKDKYTWFAVDGREHLTDESLDALEVRLRGVGFIRAHRSELVRIDAIRALERELGGTMLRLTSGETISVSRRCLAQIKAALGV